ncbi:MAG: helix-turn-helix domain-containing protein [Oscillospiraceae bacterium]
MNCLCTRTLYDEYGHPHLCVDEYMKRCSGNQADPCYRYDSLTITGPAGGCSGLTLSPPAKGLWRSLAVP